MCLTSRSVSAMMLIMRVVIFLFLLFGVKTAKSSDSTDDPSGWGSFYVTDSHLLLDNVHVVDPSGWNNDREAKISMRRKTEDKRERISNVCKSVLQKKDIDASEIEIEIENAIKSNIQTHSKGNGNDYAVFVKRFISILLYAADLSEKESGDVSRVVELKISREHLEKLLLFSNSKINISLRELDHILSSSINTKHIPTFDVSAAIEKVFFMVCQKEVWLPFFLGFVAIGIPLILVNSKSPKFFVMSVLILIFCFSYLMEYYKMYKVMEIRQRTILEKHPEVPSSCNQANQFWLATFWDSVISFGKSKNIDECEQYQKALILDPFIEVSPVRVLSSILTDFIVEPSEKLATAITTFSSTIMGDLPFYYGWLVLIASSIAIFLLVLLIIVMCVNGSVRIGGLFGGVSISKSEIQPAANTAHTKQIASDSAKNSHPILEGVAGIKNPIVIDANSLGTLLLRAQSSVTLHHSGIQELLQSLDQSTQSKPFDEKLCSGSDETKSLNGPKRRKSLSQVSSEISITQRELEVSGLEKNVSCMKNHGIENLSEPRSINESACQQHKTFVEKDNTDNAKNDVECVDNNVQISEID